MSERKPTDPPPWRKGVGGVTGVTPPGRRLSPTTEPRPTKWSASGVSGVTPPGRADPHPSQAVAAKANLHALKRRQKSIDADAKATAARPQAGFLPDIFADLRDPPDLRDFLKLLSDFLDEHPPRAEALDDIDHLITQSRAPFQLIVGFTVMSALVGRDEDLRMEFQSALERSAQAFFNLARRLNPRIRVPKGVIPEMVDALFFDLPDLSLRVPFAFATDAFMGILPLLRDEDDPAYDERLLTFSVTLRRRFIDARSFGDQPLHALFPWTPPEWAPETFRLE